MSARLGYGAVRCGAMWAGWTVTCRFPPVLKGGVAVQSLRKSKRIHNTGCVCFCFFHPFFFFCVFVSLFFGIFFWWDCALVSGSMSAVQ